MLNNSRSLIIEIVAKIRRHRIFLTPEVERVQACKEYFTTHKLATQELVGDGIPLWTVEIHNKIREWMSEVQIFAEVLVALE